MKNLFKVFMLVVCMVAMVSNIVVACPPGDRCEDQYVGAWGSVNVFTGAEGAGADASATFIPAGGAFSLAGAEGDAGASGAGRVFNGGVRANVGTTGGGLAAAGSGSAMFSGPNHFGEAVGTGAATEAVTAGGVDVGVRGLGYVGASFDGNTSQGTLSASGLIGYRGGLTGGIAGQGSNGSINGGASAFLFGASGANADITMFGGSSSESFRRLDYNGNTFTTTVGNSVSANTDVYANGDKYRRGLAGSYVCGNYSVVGGAKSLTLVDGGVAVAKGSYAGAGVLNTQYHGSANGGTFGSVTTVNGMNGEIVSTGASMKATSNVSRNSSN